MTFDEIRKLAEEQDWIVTEIPGGVRFVSPEQPGRPSKDHEIFSDVDDPREVKMLLRKLRRDGLVPPASRRNYGA